MKAVNACLGLPPNCLVIPFNNFPNFGTLSITRPHSLSFLGRNDNLRLRSTPILSTRPLRVSEFAMAESDSSFNDSKYAEILIIRHGETKWNADARLQGQLDVELNDAGRKQAVAVAERLSKEPKVAFIYSSDLSRAYNTAEKIAASFGMEVIKDPGLRERHLGVLQGIEVCNAAKACPEAHKIFMSSKKDAEIPGGGESKDQLYQRATSTLKRIGKKHIGQRIAVVTHGGFIRALHKWACPNKPVGKVPNTSVSIFRYTNDGKWTLDVWGDVSHMDKVGYLVTGFGGDRTSG